MKDKKAAKVLIKRAKLNPDLYSSADILYAKKFTAEWDKNDPEWSFLNGKTSREIQEMIEDIMKNEARRR